MGMGYLTLYIKTHLKTGLKYFGYTSKDPYEYKGSGSYWTKHRKKHGNEIQTEIYARCENMKEVKVWGIYFSKLNNIVKDRSWANQTIEEGQGGCNHNENTAKKISENHARCDGKHNSNFLGWYVTPWGTFETTTQASNAIDKKISPISVRRYCRQSDKTVKKETLLANGKKHEYFTINDIGKTMNDLGFSFIPKSQNDYKLD